VILQLSSFESQTFRDIANPSVIVVDGFGMGVHVCRNHLVISDGVGRQRRERRLTRSQRDVTRIVILGHTGSISLDAIRWCEATGITITCIDTDGRLLAFAGTPGGDDGRLRRAQAAAPNSTTGLTIGTALIGTKIEGQQANVKRLGASETADALAQMAAAARAAATLPECAGIEANASNAYFAAWAAHAQCRIVANDRGKVPAHWQRFSRRRSDIGGNSARRATDPINALLNYSYALAEAECVHAVRAVGLDPGLGILHTDKKGRDSLALDLLEPLRPIVDDVVLRLLETRWFSRRDLHETPQGSCRLVAPLTHELAAAVPNYASAVAPIAEQVAHTLAQSSPGKITLTTPLSRANTTGAQTRGARSARRRDSAPVQIGRRTCRMCGRDLYGAARQLCPTCWPVARYDSGAATPGGTTLGDGWTFDRYRTEVMPGLARVSLAEIEEATGLSHGSASRVRSGKQVPNPRHWDALAGLASANNRTLVRSICE
jgi:CRISPR-associated endonuclease Cas1